MLELVTSRDLRVAGEPERAQVPEQSASGPLPWRDYEMIKHLREEANAHKTAFAQQAFQALSIASVALGGVLYLMLQPNGFPIAALAAIPIMGFVLTTCRFGAYAYNSAHRIFGYELYLYRMMERLPRNRRDEELRRIDWEEAMGAWRVVQASLYQAVYSIGWYLWPDLPKKDIRSAQRSLWFSRSSLHGKDSDAVFYAGSHLKRTQGMLFIVAFVCSAVLMSPLIVAWLWMHAGLKGEPVLLVPFNSWILGLGFAVAMGGIAFPVARFFVERERRAIMEDGLLSISACAIVWEAVVLAHFVALKRAKECAIPDRQLQALARRASWRHRRIWKQWKAGATAFEDIVALQHDKRETDSEGGIVPCGYEFFLGDEARDLASSAKDVPAWIEKAAKKLHDDRSTRQNVMPLRPPS
jgi:hypothetical protein